MITRDTILEAAGEEANNLGSVLYIIYPRGKEAKPSNFKVVLESEFNPEKHNFYSLVHPNDAPPVEKVQVGIMAFERKTGRARSGTKGGVNGHLYKTLAMARAAVANRNKIEDYDFYPAFIEKPLDTSTLDK